MQTGLLSSILALGLCNSAAVADLPADEALVKQYVQQFGNLTFREVSVLTAVNRLVSPKSTGTGSSYYSCIEHYLLKYVVLYLTVHYAEPTQRRVVGIKSRSTAWHPFSTRRRKQHRLPYF